MTPPTAHGSVDPMGRDLTTLLRIVRRWKADEVRWAETPLGLAWVVPYKGGEALGAGEAWLTPTQFLALGIELPDRVMLVKTGEKP